MTYVTFACPLQPGQRGVGSLLLAIVLFSRSLAINYKISNHAAHECHHKVTLQRTLTPYSLYVRLPRNVAPYSGLLLRGKVLLRRWML